MKQSLKNRLALIVATASAVGATNASAVVDVAAVVSGIGEAGPAITLVAGAVLIACALVATFKLIKRAL